MFVCFGRKFGVVGGVKSCVSVLFIRHASVVCSTTLCAFDMLILRFIFQSLQKDPAVNGWKYKSVQEATACSPFLKQHHGQSLSHKVISSSMECRIKKRFFSYECCLTFHIETNWRTQLEKLSLGNAVCLELNWTEAERLRGLWVHCLHLSLLLSTHQFANTVYHLNLWHDEWHHLKRTEEQSALVSYSN